MVVHYAEAAHRTQSALSPWLCLLLPAAPPVECSMASRRCCAVPCALCSRLHSLCVVAMFVSAAAAATCEVEYALPGHKGSVNEVVFHPKEPIVGSCSNDRTIFLGELASS